MATEEADLRPPGEEEEEAVVGLGYSKPVLKKAFEGAESITGSSMNFISFTKAGTHLDGTESSNKNEYQTKEVSVDVTKLELVGSIPPQEVDEAKGLVQRIHKKLIRVINNPKHQNNSLTTNFSISIQVRSPLVGSSSLNRSTNRVWVSILVTCIPACAMSTLTESHQDLKLIFMAKFTKEGISVKLESRMFSSASELEAAKLLRETKLLKTL